MKMDNNRGSDNANLPLPYSPADERTALLRAAHTDDAIPSAATDSDNAPLLSAAAPTSNDDDEHALTPSSPAASDAASRAAITRALYTSHFLSAWNSRFFEFGAVLYLASAFPGSLRPMAAYALARGAAAVVGGPAVGRYIDRSGRLGVGRLSIVAQRVTVAASCVVFGLLAVGLLDTKALEIGGLAMLIVLACIEKLASIMNKVAVEKDWVVTIADGNGQYLQAMNAQMRRIDLICKLCGPFLISIIDGFSTKIAIAVNLGINILSVPVEYFAIERVYRKVPALHKPKCNLRRMATDTTDNESRGSVNKFTRALRSSARDLGFYFHHRAFLASFAGAILHFTVLSFGGVMVTYLLSAGYNSFHVAAGRTVSVGVELSATWLGPWAMSRVGPIRSGIWFVSWQVSCLACGGALFWTMKDPTVAATYLVGGTILSRVGLWGYELSARIIVQDEVEEEYRGTFSSVEASWQNVFELCSYAVTLIFSRPEQFRWPVLTSCAATATAAGLYVLFVRRRRGHLLHLSKCIDSSKRRRRVHGGEGDA